MKTAAPKPCACAAGMSSNGVDDVTSDVVPSCQSLSADDIRQQFEKAQDFDVTHAADWIRQVARRLVMLANKSRWIGQIWPSALPKGCRVRTEHQPSKVR